MRYQIRKSNVSNWKAKGGGKTSVLPTSILMHIPDAWQVNMVHGKDVVVVRYVAAQHY